MKILSYIQEGVTRLGVHTEAGILDVEHALTASGYLKGTSSVILQDVIAGGPGMLSRLNELARQAVSGLTVPESDSVVLLDESALQFAPCVPSHGKIICVGLNYRKHAEETNAPIPQTPILFGVMLGYPLEQQVYLQAGDSVTIEIERLGRLTNTMTI